ncbi:polysaccharide lyase 6 family protein [Amycolatopsis australiensis]|uniref:Poly(Beta-D-mannuronate) lyase n=1 Tax=Amycolatopsis australiensis TaxID=546364 RepID=A0A1K1T7R2_9PSEU|nr:polysaccharide lyase 6 family protein [Amycolatopsis australiensis]SFW92069.1 poly(beta-D-mannuronate) lyase [Amycolatopsis australiensis]
MVPTLSPTRSRSALAAAGVAGLLAVCGPMAAPAGAAAGPRTLTASSPGQLTAALAQARPGDRVEVAAGAYATGLIRVPHSGTAQAPITIAAAQPGQVRFTGAGGLDLTGASHVVVQGFAFDNDAGLTVPGNAAANRITRNTFSGNPGGADLTVKADDTEVDHNTFQNRTTQGVYLQVVGPGAHDMAQRVHVHHNYFYNHQYHGANGGESIRFGLSGRQHAVANGLIEDNLFAKADGDSEAISIKSTSNVVQYNTIVNSRGTISLRHGWNTRVEGNILIGGSTGIRFFGNNHVIVNNVVEDTTGPAMEVGGGEVRDDTTSGTDHEAADHCLAAFNTLSGSGPLVWYNSGKPFPPSDDTLADNILLGHGQPAAKESGTSSHFTGNILFGSPAGTLPAGAYKTVDPKLVKDAHGLLRPAADSPAIGAATGSFPQVTLDIDQQTRPAAKDTGADQHNIATPARPLTPADVGPNAP